VRRALINRAELDAAPAPRTDAEHYELHRRAIERIARELAASYIGSSRNLGEPVAHLLKQAAGGLDVDGAVAAVARETLQTKRVSDEFRAHAERTLETWWQDHKGRRRVLEALDAVLAVTPAAIAAPIAIYSGGIGVSEAVVVAGPFVEQFVARVIEYQFGDAMFDFLSPWKKERQNVLERALRKHLTNPCVAEVLAYLEPLEGDVVADLRRWREQCLKAS
jgi:hypothetical protein